MQGRYYLGKIKIPGFDEKAFAETECLANAFSFGFSIPFFYLRELILDISVLLGRSLQTILLNFKTAQKGNKMTLEEKINTDLKEAMKAKNKLALRGIRAIKSAILLSKTDGSGTALTEESEIKLLQKLVKQRRDSLEIYEKQNREDLAVTEREEITIIEKYLPAQMSEADLEPVIAGIIAQTGAASMKDMGKVMGMASKQLAGKADGKLISGVVKRLLS